MKPVPKIIPVTDLRQDSAAVLKHVQESNEPLVITQRGRAAGVLLSVDAYESSQRERELLRLLALGEKEISEGKGHSLDSVLKDADAIVRDDRA